MNYTILLRILFFLVVLTLALPAGMNYTGSIAIFVLFTFSFNMLLFLGLVRGASYFDTFIGLFLWLGFWLKIVVRVGFLDSHFHESVGKFAGDGASFDVALLASSVGALGFVVASLVRRWRFPLGFQGEGHETQYLYDFYVQYRKPLWIIITLLVVLVFLTNIYFGFYQRGEVARTSLPFGLNGIFAWLLQFGLASVMAFVIHFEIRFADKLSLVSLLLPLLESFASSVSLLSRGMVLNVSSFAVAGLRVALSGKLKWFKAGLLAALMFFMLFGTSVYLVNQLRLNSYLDGATEQMGIDLRESEDFNSDTVLGQMWLSLIIDRWVGVEGVLAVTASGQQGWDLWGDAWAEKFTPGVLSLYDSRLIDSPYTEERINKKRNHYVSLPGLIAFAWYPGSLLFLFAFTLGAGMIGSVFEYFVWRFGGANPFLVALFSQVLAFRYASFGYVPAQSYLLLGALCLNVLLVLLFDSILRRFQAFSGGGTKVAD